MSPASKSQPRKRTAARKKSTTPKKVKTAKVKSQRKSVIDDSIVADTITLGHRAEILSDLDEIVAIEDSSVANDKDEN
ncbi:hypothetical protein KKC47_02120, partial [Patescibacteria group bacterium]|nr:hypothetical protein [Patescibacteria group bacterium]